MSNLRKLELPPQGLKTLCGVQDQNIKYLESLLNVSIGARGNEIMIDGAPDAIETVENILLDFADLFDEGNQFTDKELRDAFKQIADRIPRMADIVALLQFKRCLGPPESGASRPCPATPRPGGMNLATRASVDRPTPNRRTR